MNIENLKLVREAVARDKQHDLDLPDGATTGFIMSRYKHECGTPACIAGHATFLKNNGSLLGLFDDEIHFEARDWLGLTRDQAGELFTLWSVNNYPLYAVTKEQALATLDNLIETGEVVWNLPEWVDPDEDEE